MKIKIGDMEFVEEARLTHASGYAIAIRVAEQQRADNVLQAKVSAFLLTAKACYIERYGHKPERSTVDEF